ncbi:MAG TPA: SelB C-terminal domain-containing protein, partial [Gaiellaceae bacterium]|nr:SelB C-terminal domain-containing protein [Gaiellaceae bacterium]
PAWLEELREGLAARIAAADPLEPGIPVPSEPWARDIAPLLGLERRGSRLYLPEAAPALEGARAEEAGRLRAALGAAGFEPVKVEDARLAAFLEEAGEVVRVGDGLALGASAFAEARRLVVEECEDAGSITLARLRDRLGTGRRPAQLILERLDADGVTRRVGDERVLRRKNR